MKVENIRITPQLFELLDKYRLSTARKGHRWAVGQVINLVDKARIEQYAQVLIGQWLPLEIGAFSYCHGQFHPAMKIGRYCSLSWGVQVIEGDHPIDWATTSPVTHNPNDIRGLAVYLNDRKIKDYALLPYAPSSLPMTLGHDVWIGMNVMIKRGVTIGHGAVIGAGSLVTKDVPPYAIVAGTPAKILRYRFPEPLIERLLASEWWRYGPERLQALDPSDMPAFLDRLDAAVAAGLQPLTLATLTGQEIIAAGEPA